MDSRAKSNNIEDIEKCDLERLQGNVISDLFSDKSLPKCVLTQKIDALGLNF